MPATTHPLEVLSQDLRALQLRALRARAPDQHAGHAARLAANTADAVGSMHRVLEASGIGAERVESCLVRAEGDRRFTFLHVIPSAAVLTVARSRALEQGLFGTTSDETAELGLLLSLFTILLDGLVDEAPEALGADAPLLADVMLRQEWAATGVAPAFPARPDRHPAAALLCDATTEIIRRVVAGDGWRAGGEVRRRFAVAARAAYVAEAASVPLTMLDGPPGDRTALAAAVRAKSVEWAVVTALAPLCVRGLPDALDLDAYDRFARALGTFGGWIDDVADVLPDLRDGRWSNVLLELAGGAGPWPGTDLRTTLAYRLADEAAAAQVTRHGIRLYDHALAQLGALPLDGDPVAAVLADVVECALEPEAT